MVTKSEYDRYVAVACDCVPTEREIELMQHLLDKWEKQDKYDMFGACVEAYYLGKYMSEHKVLIDSPSAV